MSYSRTQVFSRQCERGFTVCSRCDDPPNAVEVVISWTQVRIQDLSKGGGGSRDFADIAQWSRGGGKNLGLKMGGQGGVPGPRAPRPPPP